MKGNRKNFDKPDSCRRMIESLPMKFMKRTKHIAAAFFTVIAGVMSMDAQSNPNATATEQPAISKVDQLKQISVEIRMIPNYYDYPLLVETLYDVTTALNKATNPNFPVLPVSPSEKEVNYRGLSPASAASMKNIMAHLQAIPGYQNSRLLLDATRSMAAALARAESR